MHGSHTPRRGLTQGRRDATELMAPASRRLRRQTLPWERLPAESTAVAAQQRAYIARAASLGVSVHKATKNRMTFCPCRLAV